MSEERFESADRAPRRALQQLVLRAAPARHDELRTAAFGNPQEVRAIGDLVGGGKRIDR